MPPVMDVPSINTLTMLTVYVAVWLHGKAVLRLPCSCNWQVPASDKRVELAIYQKFPNPFVVAVFNSGLSPTVHVELALAGISAAALTHNWAIAAMQSGLAAAPKQNPSHLVCGPLLSLVAKYSYDSGHANVDVWTKTGPHLLTYY